MTSTKQVRCPACGVMFDIGAIAGHPDIEPIGMLFENGDYLYFFNHVAANCGTTFVIQAARFLPYITEQIPENVLTGEEGCGGNCLRAADLESCSMACRYAPFRRFLLAMRAMRSATDTPSGG